jgi:hypothetical protein
MDRKLKHYIDKVLPYRLYALSIFRLFLSFIEEFPDGGDYVCSVDGREIVKGKSTAITNPSIEMGIIHSRVLLEFLGLKLNKDGSRLCNTKPRNTDVSITDYSLPQVTREQVLAPCSGDKNQAEQGFVHIITAANKLVAHSTDIIEIDKDAINSYLMCSKAIPVLFNLYFYQPLKLPMPDIELTKDHTNTSNAK